MKYVELRLNTIYNNAKDGILQIYIPDIVNITHFSKRDAIILCPGGAYQITSDREAEPIALKFLTFGYSVFVLRYTTSNPDLEEGCYPYCVDEVEDTLDYIIKNKEKYNINNIYLMGFSAGGHLASYVACTTKKEIKGLILGYPVITMGEYTHALSRSNLLKNNLSDEVIFNMSVENLVSKNTPPTFIFTTQDDDSVPFENTLSLISSLRKNKVSFECHIFANGPHGIALANDETSTFEEFNRNDIAYWPELAKTFMKRL